MNTRHRHPTPPGLLPAICLLCLGSIVATPRDAHADGKPSAFTFVVMGDSHVGKDPQAPVSEPFARVIDEVNRLNPDFVVLAGDMIEGGYDPAALDRMWDQFDEAMARFRMPVYQVVGNHDVSNRSRQESYLRRYGDRFPLYYGFDHHGCRLIVLNSEVLNDPGRVTGAQLDWLRRELDAYAQAREIFVFLHQPLFAFGGQADWMRDVHPLLARHRVSAVFAGHDHRCLQMDTVEGVRYFITGGANHPIGPLEERGNHYCLVTVTEAPATVSVIQTGNIHPEDVVRASRDAHRHDLIRSIATIGVPLEKESDRFPEETRIVIDNPFDGRLTGSLAWNVPEASPWTLPYEPVRIDVGPGGQETVRLTSPPAASLADTASYAPLPVALWTLSVNGTSLVSNRLARVFPDPWPHQETRARLHRSVRFESHQRIVVDDPLETAIRLFCENPTDMAIEHRMVWRLPDESGWTLSPHSNVTALQPGDSRSATFRAWFTGGPEALIPPPRLDVEVRMAERDVSRFSLPLPIDTRAFFAQRPPTLDAVRADPVPPLDGDITDNAWGQAPLASAFLNIDGNNPAGQPTEVRMLYDDVNLYITVHCVEPRFDLVRAEITEHDGDLWTDDAIELFLDTNLDRETYFHYIVNSKGVTYDARYVPPDGRPTGKAWDGPCDIRTGTTADAWTLEITLPWSSLDIPSPRPGDRMGLQIARSRRAGRRELSRWAPTFVPGNHTPERFGWLIFR